MDAYQQIIIAPTEIPIARGVVFTRSIFAALASLLGAVLMAIVGYPIAQTKAHNLAEAVLIRSAAFSYIIFILAALVSVINGFCWMVSPGLRLYPEGFQYGPRPKMICWRDIEKIELRVGWLQAISCVSVHLKEAKPGFVQNVKDRLRYGAIMINHRYLQATADEVMDVMNRYLHAEPSTYSNYPREL